MVMGAGRSEFCKAGCKLRVLCYSLEAEFLPPLVQLLVFAGDPWLP